MQEEMNREAEDLLRESGADRFREALKGGIVHMVRVSSPEQAKRSAGSLKSQRMHIEYLKRLGIAEERIEIVELLGESGSGDAERPKFREIVRRARRKEILIVSITRDDRLSRSGQDAEDLYNALADHGGYAVVGGVVYDPANHAQRMMLSVGAAMAEMENNQRSERLIPNPAD